MKIIINADDFGLAPSINQAVKNLSQYGTISSTSVLANMPFANQAESLQGISIGLHINFTQGYPVCKPAEIPSLVDKNGLFHSKTTLVKLLSEKKVLLIEVEKELKAQYSRLKEITNNRVDHFDSHQGSTRLQGIFSVLKQIANSERRIRVHNKYYLINGEIIYRPIDQILKLGIKRTAKEFVFRWTRNAWRKDFVTPDGMLISKSHQTLDTLHALQELKQDDKTSHLILEISCHPAININDLSGTVLLNERVAEYEYLSSQDFIQTAKSISFAQYQDL